MAECDESSVEEFKRGLAERDAALMHSLFTDYISIHAPDGQGGFLLPKVLAEHLLAEGYFKDWLVL